MDDHDAEVTRKVAARGPARRRDAPEPAVGEAYWRRHLVSLGHDPLKPVT